MAAEPERLEALAQKCRDMGVTDIDPVTRRVTLDPAIALRAMNRRRVLDVPKAERSLVTGGDPDERYPVPKKDDFEREFAPAPDLAEIAEALIDAHQDRFGWIRDYCRVVYLWKAEGGAVNGCATLGKCQKPGGLLKLFSDAQYIIWLAADHARDLYLTRWQVEALLFHEMSHTRMGDNGPALRGHDFAGFRSELEQYGAWESDLRLAAQAFQQLALFDEGEDSESAAD
jgi:hypothetical protein